MDELDYTFEEENYIPCMELPVTGDEVAIAEKWVQEYAELKKTYDRVSKEKTELYKELTAREMSFSEWLRNKGKKDYNTNDFAFSWREDKSFKLDAENKHQFLEWLEANGLRNMLTVHSQTLNAFCKKELEEKGQDFKIPGIVEGQPVLRTTFRKRK